LAKFVILIVVAYALSPIDLIPDFIPILGLLDDLVLLPLGIALAIRLIPDQVFRDCRNRAQREGNWTAAPNRLAAACVIVLWFILIALLIVWIFSA